MRRIGKWLMNPDNNPTMIGFTVGFVVLCIIISFIGVK